MSLHKDPDPFDRRTEVDLKVSVIRVAFYIKVNSSSGDWNTQEVQLIHPSLKGFLGSFSLKCPNAPEEPPRAERWREGPHSGLMSKGSPPPAQGPIMLSLEKCLFMVDVVKRELLLIFFFCCCLFCVCLQSLFFIHYMYLWRQIRIQISKDLGKRLPTVPSPRHSTLLTLADSFLYIHS